MNNFETMPSPREFISNKNEPLIPQLMGFAPGKNPDFTALKCLKNSDDIQNYFAERIVQEKNNNENDMFPGETVRSQLAYIANYGDDLKQGWERFLQVIGEQVRDITNEVRES